MTVLCLVVGGSEGDDLQGLMEIKARCVRRNLPLSVVLKVLVLEQNFITVKLGLILHPYLGRVLSGQMKKWKYGRKYAPNSL